MALPERQGLYDPRNEHDSCGIGFVANIKGRKSHDIIARGLQILVNLDHRGAVGADPLVGDGAGCLIQMPDALLRDWAAGQGLVLPEPGRYAVAMCFLPRDAAARDFAIRHIEHLIQAEGQSLLGWRDVPTDTDRARRAGDRDDADDPAGDRRRRPGARRSGRVRAQDPDDPQAGAEQRRRRSPHSTVCRACPSSTCRLFRRRTLVYKGLLLAPQVGSFYRGSAQSADGLGAGAGASALFDQHLPVMAAGASRTGFCATTARSTRCAATSIGWRRAARR